MITSIFLHVLSSVFVASALSLMVGHLTPWIAAVSLLMGTVVAVYSYKKLQSKNEPQFVSEGFFANTVFFVTTLFIIRQTMYLLYDVGHQIKTLDVSNYGDLTFHVGILKNIANGDRFWPQFIELAGHPLQYPFGVDFYNALWEALCVPTQSHLFFVGAILLVCLMFTAYWWVGILGVIAIFFNGGWQGYEFIKAGIVKDYQGAWAWKNFFATLLIPQRGFLMGLPIGIYLLKKTIDGVFENYVFSKTEKYIFAFMWGMLPIFHMHTFIAVTLLMVILASLDPEGIRSVLRNFKRKENLKILTGAFILASTWILPLTGFFKKASIIHLQKGWGLGEHSLWQSLFWNYGPWLYLLIYSVYAVYYKKRSIEKKILYTGLIVFVIFQFVIMAPWEWDNIKVLIWPYLLMVSVLAKVINDEFSAKLRIPLYMILGFSGFISVLSISNSQNRGHALYEDIEINAAQSAMKSVPKNAVFAAFPTYNHPLTYFGKVVAFGFDGHIWSHGLKEDNRREKLQKIFTGAPEWKELAKEMGVTHIYWGPRERSEYKSDNQPWRSMKNLSRATEVEIYEIE